jgi:molybdate transport system substrate-binding protein
MRDCRKWRLLIALAALMIGSSAGAQERRVKVAAAADLKFAMDELAQKFQAKNGVKVDVTYGSSGNFFSQIQNGAPFDVFFSADIEYPQKLGAMGLADSASLYRYALGRIVIWTPMGAKAEVKRDTWKVFADPSVQKVAIANPQHAPYGRAAVAAMQKAGVYEQTKPKLVLGENISQAAQFVQSGNAQVGIVALSLALSPGMKGGTFWMIPGEMHPPIEQAAIVLQGAKEKDAAAEFLDFVRSLQGQKILKQFGFQIPAAKT